MAALLVLLALARGQSQMTCEDCSNLADALAKASTSDSAIAAELAVILPVVCPGAPDPAECEDELPAFWEAIARAVFTDDYGWWAPRYFCQVTSSYC